MFNLGFFKSSLNLVVRLTSEQIWTQLYKRSSYSSDPNSFYKLSTPPPTPKPKIIIVITLSSNLGNLFIKNSQNHNTFGYQSITIQIFTYCYSIIYFCMCPITFAYQSFLFYILLPRTCTRRWWHEQIFHAQNCDTNEV